MNPGLYVLCAAGFFFFAAIIVQGFKEPKIGLHASVHNAESPEKVERQFNRVRNLQRFYLWTGVALLVAAAATFIVPEWDNILRNISKDK